MANSNNPFGLYWLGQYGGGVTNSPLQERRNGILSTNTTAMYFGDLIRTSANGYLYEWVAATSVASCAGVFNGCRFLLSVTNEITPSKYWPGTGAASGSILAQYIPGFLSPTAVYAIQTDSTGITVADIGACADIVVGTGSTLSGRSGSYLDTTTLTSTSATLPLRIVDLYANWAMGNQAEEAGAGSGLIAGTQAGAYNWAVVALNSAATVGV